MIAVCAATPAHAAHGTPVGFDPAAIHPISISLETMRVRGLHRGEAVTGIASWYGPGWAGRRTASGRRFNPEAMTAASANLPLGARVLVTLQGSARSVLVTITDRAAAVGRIIDLSRGAARRIGILARGTARVVLTRI